MTSKRGLLLPAIFIIILILIALAANFSQVTGAFTLSGNSGHANAQEKTIKVGAILMLTGEGAAIGQEMQRGIELMVREINVDKNSKFKVQVIYEDSGFIDNQKIVSAAQKLIYVDNVDLVIADTTEVIRPIKYTLEQTNTPAIVVWDSTNEMNSSKNIFSTGFSVEKTGEIMADFFKNKLGVKTLAIVSHEDTWAELVSDSLRKKFEQEGGKVLMQEKVPVEETDFKTIISKVNESGAEGLAHIFIPTNSVVLFFKQTKQMGFQAKTLTADFTFYKSMLGDAEDSMEGVYFTNLYITNNPLLEKINQDYIKQYREEPVMAEFFSFGYDGMRVFDEALKTTTDFSKQGIIDALGKIENFPLAGGGEITLTKGMQKNRVEDVFVIKNGKAVPAE
ncbi:Periplasmic binding protein [uncultured archaeon]|nr:Periplasmic binding protein [uncultured archaeon]